MVNLFVCGDIYNKKVQDGNICSNELSKIIIEADYSVCNFEAPVDGCGQPRPNNPGNPINQRKETIDGLKSQGFNLLLLANNHMMDYGADALTATLEKARKNGLETLGAGLNSDTIYKHLIKNINGLKLGMINACEAQFGVHDYYKNKKEPSYAWINHHFIDQAILDLRKKCDFIIIFSHAGLEYYPVPQKEWRERYKHLCDLGADLVIGSHPHVPQGFERHKGSLIFYSLGNFLFHSKSRKDQRDQSFALWLELEKNNPVSFTPVYHFTKDRRVHLAPPEKTIDIEELSSLLRDSYFELHDKMSIETYNSLRRKLLLCLMPIPFDGNIKSTFSRIKAKIIGRSKKIKKEPLLLHMLRNESYHFAMKHALELLSKEKYIK